MMVVSSLSQCLVTDHVWGTCRLFTDHCKTSTYYYPPSTYSFPTPSGYNFYNFPTPNPTGTIPTAEPSSFPSSSMSAAVFKFLAESSFDGGKALSIAGSPQRKAFHWLVTQAELSGSYLSYYGIQNHVLATLYYATSGSQWQFSNMTTGTLNG